MRASIQSTRFGHGAPEGSIREFAQLLGVAGRRPSRGPCHRLLQRHLRASSPALLRVPLQSLGATAALPVVSLQAGKLLCVNQTCMQLGVEGDASLCMHKHPIDISMASWRNCRSGSENIFKEFLDISIHPGRIRTILDRSWSILMDLDLSAWWMDHPYGC